MPLFSSFQVSKFGNKCANSILLVWVQNFDTQYQFAIQTLSTVILTTFQLRCQARWELSRHLRLHAA